MGNIVQWFKRTFPDTVEFIRNFFKTMNNKPEGHSIRKWLSVGCFWILAEICIKYTDANTIVAVAGVLSALITTLVITHTVGNYQDKKLDKLTTPTPDGGSGPITQ